MTRKLTYDEYEQYLMSRSDRDGVIRTLLLQVRAFESMANLENESLTQENEKLSERVETLRAAVMRAKGIEPTTDIGVLGLSHVTVNRLQGGYDTIGDLQKATDAELLRCPLIGKKKLKEIRDALESLYA